VLVAQATRTGTPVGGEVSNGDKQSAKGAVAHLESIRGEAQAMGVKPISALAPWGVGPLTSGDVGHAPTAAGRGHRAREQLPCDRKQLLPHPVSSSRLPPTRPSPAHGSRPQRQHFTVERGSPSDEAVKFQEANIKDLLVSFGPMMGAKPETVIHRVFASV